MIFRKPTKLFQNLFEVIRNILQVEKFQCNKLFWAKYYCLRLLIIAKNAKTTNEENWKAEMKKSKYFKYKILCEDKVFQERNFGAKMSQCIAMQIEKEKKLKNINKILKFVEKWITFKNAHSNTLQR